MAVLRPWQWFVLIVAGGVTLMTFQGARTLTEHEVFAAEPAREMLAGEGWLLQPFAGEVRTKKPPGQSWLIAASLAVTRSHSEWAARLPSALSGIGLAVAAAMIAARIGSARQGLIAGLMTLTCVGVQQRARLAEADMALALCVAVANAAVLRALIKVDRGTGFQPVSFEEEVRHGLKTRVTTCRAAVLFWAAIVAGFLLKGPIVLGFTVLPAAVAWAVLRFGTRDRAAAATLARAAFWWPAVVGGVLLMLAWPLAAGHQYPAAWAAWKREIVDRTQGELGHGDERRNDPLLSYAWLLPTSTLPWCVFVVPAVVWAWRVRRRPANVLLICWCACGVAVVSAIAFKVLHYVLPAIVPVLVLAAFGFDRLLSRWLRRRPAARRPGRERAALAGWFGVAAVAWLVWSGWVLPAKDWAKHVKAFAHRVDAVVPVGRTVHFYHPTDDRSGEDHTAWYLSHPLRQATVVPDARPAYLICGSADADELTRTQHAVVLGAAEGVSTREGAARNDRVLVRVDAR